ncbi:hypothetical protein VP01_2719g3 [Puccinia sorghi]|uniref:Uncharacterized protein n=1 Tax=Puccinia sorghi TaxID=27349 RepID=A0A0L6V574_9BASI|nr:hypothetical protein VP01_2719g3 [Puccinia sorghi]
MHNLSIMETLNLKVLRHPPQLQKKAGNQISTNLEKKSFFEDTKVINLETVVAENNAYQKKALEISFVQQLKDLEHIPEEINKLMGEPFSQGKGASCDVMLIQHNHVSIITYIFFFFLILYIFVIVCFPQGKSLPTIYIEKLNSHFPQNQFYSPEGKIPCLHPVPHLQPIYKMTDYLLKKLKFKFQLVQKKEKESYTVAIKISSSSLTNNQANSVLLTPPATVAAKNTPISTDTTSHFILEEGSRIACLCMNNRQKKTKTPANSKPRWEDHHEPMLLEYLAHQVDVHFSEVEIYLVRRMCIFSKKFGYFPKQNPGKIDKAGGIPKEEAPNLMQSWVTHKNCICP